MQHNRIEKQIERCRRLAAMMTDDDLRHSLEALAEEYEAELEASQDHFMLREKGAR